MVKQFASEEELSDYLHGLKCSKLMGQIVDYKLEKLDEFSYRVLITPVAPVDFIHIDLSLSHHEEENT